eukprot:TRINITY_DN3447_c0_g1_i1.p1 TRINITY_DN3447_c0_g1~~TRINITY_DN3447_c0_g1_i1.p1  ORF type:complete len:321 (-),score=42.31 TRINITY_DN3447_c0_g1_i1:475-1386(-)
MATAMVENAIREIFEWSGNPMKSAKDALSHDEGCILAAIIVAGLEILSTSSAFDSPGISSSLHTLASLVEAKGSPSDVLHLEALRHFARGDLTRASECWERVLLANPVDAIALKFAYDSYFYYGDSRQIRDTIARVRPYWHGHPLESYLDGMIAFGYEETNLYHSALQYAKRAVTVHPNDAWAVHAIAHVHEERGQPALGIEWLRDTATNWRAADGLACHLYWHWTLYHLDLGQFDEAKSIFDDEICVRARASGAALDMVDAASLLLRLSLQQVDVGQRWNEIAETLASHMFDHALVRTPIYM